uniref:Synaptopodin 2 n=1 Tax=Leptobrachium leishanense TaxID=445787 RepID=A0A8C5LL00_9ANUR
MGTGDYICITMTGGSPWGFRLQGGTEFQESLNVSKVRSMSKASIAGLYVGDEVVSINGNPCTDIPYSEVVTLIEKATDILQMLVKRALSKTASQNRNGGGEFVNREEYIESSTLEIRPSLESTIKSEDISDTQDQSFHTKGDVSLTTLLQDESPIITPNLIEIQKTCVTGEIPLVRRAEDAKQGAMVELHLSLSPDMQLGPGTPIVTVLGAENTKSSDTKHEIEQQGDSIVVTEVCLSQREPPVQQSSTTFQIVGRPQTKIIPVAEADDPSFPRVELILDCSGREKEPRSQSDRGSAKSGEEGGQSEAPPSAVSFGITVEDLEQGEEDQQAESDHIRPNKHRARHAKLRRSESLSEKQVKEAKSKCKSIALLLTAAPNPRSKGVLMFKKRRQRARKYTLISYGTGELEREEEGEDDDEDDENEEADKENTFKVAFYGTSNSDLDEDFFSDPENEAQVVTFDWDTGLVEVERKLKSGEAMEELPETKGKGVLMFARRKQRMEQITAEQEEQRKHTMVENVTMTENINNGVSYGEQQKETIKTQSCVSKSYIEVSHGRVQNGIAGGHEFTSSFSLPEPTGLNKTAKPFGGYQNVSAIQFSSPRSPVSDVPAPPPYCSVTPPPEPMYHVSSPVASKVQTAVWSPTYPNEQIASRDERIAVPAIRTGILQDTKRKTAKPMFTFKEQPKLSPNPELLSLVQDREGKRSTGAGNESGPEEDYLSLGAEACNFMQAHSGKQKTPPPVAPKPSVRSPTTPLSPVWVPPSVAIATQQVFPIQNTSQSTTPPQATIPEPIPHPYNPPATLNLSGPYREPPAAAGGANQVHAYKTPPTTPHGFSAVAGGVGPAYEMPALRGKGAELFAKRQSRMEKYVVDSATVQAHAARPASPTASLPSSWKYSSNVRAPPPLAYNPIQSPLYPPAATKSTSKSGSSMAKNTKKKPTKALTPLEVMKHQPYQLNTSLFTFQPPSEAAAATTATKQNFKPDSKPPLRQVQSIKQVNSPSNFHSAAPAYPQQFNNAEPSFQASVFTPPIESCSPVGYSMYPRQESPVATLIAPPRPKFSAKKAGVSAQGQVNMRSMSLPGRGFSSGCIQPLLSPSSPLVFGPSPGKPVATPETPSKKLTPWEAAAKSPLGLVDDAFLPQNIHETISANIVSVARRKTLPAPPAAWKSTSKMPPGPTSYPYGSLQEKKPTSVTSLPKSVVSAPSFQCGYQLRYPYSSQNSITSPRSVPLDTRSEYCMSSRNTNYNAYARPWRR